MITFQVSKHHLIRQSEVGSLAPTGEVIPFYVVWLLQR